MARQAPSGTSLLTPFLEECPQALAVVARDLILTIDRPLLLIDGSSITDCHITFVKNGYFLLEHHRRIVFTTNYLTNDPGWRAKHMVEVRISQKPEHFQQMVLGRNRAQFVGQMRIGGNYTELT